MRVGGSGGWGRSPFGAEGTGAIDDEDSRPDRRGGPKRMRWKPSARFDAVATAPPADLVRVRAVGCSDAAHNPFVEDDAGPVEAHARVAEEPSQERPRS
jgi:hypothetical protein